MLEFAEDMEVDIPRIWSYLGELIGPMVQDGSVPLSFLKQAAEPLKPCNKAGVLVAEVLHAVATNIVSGTSILFINCCCISLDIELKGCTVRSYRNISQNIYYLDLKIKNVIY